MSGLLASSNGENGEVMTVANRTYAKEGGNAKGDLIYDVGMNDGGRRGLLFIKVSVCWLLKPTWFSPQRQSVDFKRRFENGDCSRTTKLLQR